ncbi:hypothetical protein KY285_019973 [Solanum tuberosum]|nr:hypothetical protein KY285_019973 [Solanum tuberosum]
MKLWAQTTQDINNKFRVGNWDTNNREFIRNRSNILQILGDWLGVFGQLLFAELEAAPVVTIVGSTDAIKNGNDLVGPVPIVEPLPIAAELMLAPVVAVMPMVPTHPQASYHFGSCLFPNLRGECTPASSVSSSVAESILGSW